MLIDGTADKDTKIEKKNIFNLHKTMFGYFKNIQKLFVFFVCFETKQSISNRKAFPIVE